MESDSTQITGSPAGLKGPRPGDVVCERYDIRDVVESDALVVTYRAIDQETDGPVLVRTTAPGLLGEKEARRVAERLRPLLGARGHPSGGSAWPGLLDVEREGSFVVVVEPWPRGTSFRAVLEARRAKRKGFDPTELLPLIARLSAALEGLRDDGPLAGLHHGDLRAQRIFVHPDGVVMTGGFLVAALPGDAVAEALARDLVLRRALAPEVADGLAGRPADRFAIAALAWEALEGDPPPPSVQPADCRSEPALGAILVRYLDPDPSARPATLRGLVDALAARAGVPAPSHEDRLVFAAGASAQDDSEQTTETGSYQLADGEILPLDTSPRHREGEPRAKEPAPSKARRSASDLDPDLVAAARASSSISETGTFQLDGQELVPVAPARSGAAAKSTAASSRGASGTPEPAASRASAGRAVVAAPAKASEPRPHAPAAQAAPTRPEPRPLPASSAQSAPARPEPKPPAGAQTANARTSAPKAPVPVKAQGEPKPTPASGAATQTPRASSAVDARAVPSSAQASRSQASRRAADRTQELADQDLEAVPASARPRPRWEHETLPASGAPLPSLTSAPRESPGIAGPPQTAPPVPAAPAETSGSSGMMLIVSAVVLALVILGGAFWYRAREEQLRQEQEIEQRLRDLRH